MTKKLVLRTVVWVLLTVVLAACGNIKPSLTMAEIIAQRAQARVDAMISGDYAAAYQYYTPGYRSSVDQADFIVRFKVSRVKWTAGRFVDTNCEDKVCNVRMDIDYYIDEPLRGVSEFRGTRRIEELWIEVDEQWYYVDES